MQRYYIKTVGFTSIQFNMEGYLVTSIIFGTALLIQALVLGTFPYSFAQVMWALLAAFLSASGAICITEAF